MYLKSLEIHGFKSFANKIVFDFHNGITGIVGPNGSGKSNVADAIRWVLGEQSAKQLRGASMQDVIFAGTENRKPLSYAYVAITLDNSDRTLAIGYDEVTVARRVYRSGESEYLLNGSVCRLKQIAELFYDTGIGKEGYSIIGQGQIDRILSGKPEERRELFDEAAGIVKFKKRKLTAQKKLDSERENLVRVNDILSELERQVGPLEKQSEKARIYLKKREELRGYDVNLFLMEQEKLHTELDAAEKSYEIADQEMTAAQQDYEKICVQYDELGNELSSLDTSIEQVRSEVLEASATKQKLENQIALLKEQIHTSEISHEMLENRLKSMETEKKARYKSQENYLIQKENTASQLIYWNRKGQKSLDLLGAIQQKITELNEKIENCRKAQVANLEKKASIKGRQQRLAATMEQLNIRRSELNKKLLTSQSQGIDLSSAVDEAKQEWEAVSRIVSSLEDREKKIEEKDREWTSGLFEANKKAEELKLNYHRANSRLETLKNIAERYDGYGNSIRRVMEKKNVTPGLIGVVSDLIHVEKKYEIAIETALGGTIQNIVTEDENTAKQMIEYLKVNRYGRATFLPLSSMKARTNPKNDSAIREPGAIGIADRLISCEVRYRELAGYLLGRILVVDNIDHAIAIARKYRYTLNIVTLEGESLSPGGSMTGGAYKSSTNLLGRNREIDELTRETAKLRQELTKVQSRREDLQTAQVLTRDELEEIRQELQQKKIDENTARLNYEQICKEQEDSESLYENLQKENEEIERETELVAQNRQEIDAENQNSNRQKEEIEAEIEQASGMLETLKKEEEKASASVQEIQLQTAELNKTAEFIEQNISRLGEEVERFDRESAQLKESLGTTKESVDDKNRQITEIEAAITISSAAEGAKKTQLETKMALRDQKNTAYRGMFSRQQEVSDRKNRLDRELYRLSMQRDRLKEQDETQINYLWQEYELTPHAALEYKSTEYGSLTAVRERTRQIKDEIKKLGSVNVGAIDEYIEVSTRYQFMKTQHDDLVQAEKTLMSVIGDLDTGMRKQFTEKFAQIQKAFDDTFQALFGGGKGTLELVEDEDILECGIRIIAQPPGKKLQNMMQLSGGEKALSAIALLFAIQTLKPSPFCLLDEIEAALDDSNVDRYANYLNNLTTHTQFIVITHRRGTMAAADRLYGITMQEKGVSTLVSVNLISDELT